MRAVIRSILLLAVLAAAAGATMIKPGDLLDIKVMSHPEFSGVFNVSESGTIDYPLLADEAVANVSTSELMNDLTFRLARHIDNPLVLISVMGNPLMVVTVLGQIVNPGPVETNQGATLQEVIRKAGGPTEAADIQRIKVIHQNPSQAPEEGNLREFMEQGSLEKLPDLYNGDVVIVLSQERARKVKVIGAVQKPGLFALEEKMNVFEIIYLAGGPAEKADLTRVRRFSLDKGTTTEEILDIQSYIDKGKMDNIPRVDEGDVIIVYSRWFDWKALLTILNNTLLFIVTIQAFSGVFK